MRHVRSVLRASFLTVMLAACGRDGGTTPEPLPDPFLSATLTGGVTASFQGTPRITRFNAVIDDYEFQMITESTNRNEFIHIWGEGARPRVGTYPLTPWREGEAGTRMHAMVSLAESYQAVSGELRITSSTPEGIVGEFRFHGVPGYLMPDRAVLSTQGQPIEVQGSFSAQCSGNDVCR